MNGVEAKRMVQKLKVGVKAENRHKSRKQAQKPKGWHRSRKDGIKAERIKFGQFRNEVPNLF